jgi:hypothetical protein
VSKLLDLSVSADVGEAARLTASAPQKAASGRKLGFGSGRYVASALIVRSVYRPAQRDGAGVRAALLLPVAHR